MKIEQIFFDEIYLNYRARQVKIDLEVLNSDKRSLERFEEILDDEINGSE